MNCLSAPSTRLTREKSSAVTKNLRTRKESALEDSTAREIGWEIEGTLMSLMTFYLLLTFST